MNPDDIIRTISPESGQEEVPPGPCLRCGAGWGRPCPIPTAATSCRRNHRPAVAGRIPEPLEHARDQPRRLARRKRKGKKR